MSQNHIDFVYTQPNTIIILKDSIPHHLYSWRNPHFKRAPTINAQGLLYRPSQSNSWTPFAGSQWHHFIMSEVEENNKSKVTLHNKISISVIMRTNIIGQ